VPKVEAKEKRRIGGNCHEHEKYEEEGSSGGGEGHEEELDLSCGKEVCTVAS
jgi:hypothetical protein